MKIELLCGNGIKNAFKDLNIDATKTYTGTADKEKRKSYYEVWEVEKNDLRKLESVLEWKNAYGWFCYAKGSRMGSAYELLTINGQMIIGWETVNGVDTFDNLTDYIADGLGAHNVDDVCAIAVDLAKSNGMTLAKLFKVCQG